MSGKNYSKIIGRVQQKRNVVSNYSPKARIYVGLLYKQLAKLSEDFGSISDQSTVRDLNKNMQFGHICYDSLKGTGGKVVPTNHATILISRKGYKNRFLRNFDKKDDIDVQAINVPFEYSVRVFEDNYARPNVFIGGGVLQPKTSISMTRYYRQMPPVQIEWFNAGKPDDFYNKYPEFFIPSSGSLAKEPGRAEQIKKRNLTAAARGTFRDSSLPLQVSV